MDHRRRLRTLLLRFSRDPRGSVAMMFGLLVLLLVGLAGVAFDYSRMALVQTNLQRAVDAAVLLVARNRDIIGPQGMPDALASSYMRRTFDLEQLQNVSVKVTLVEDRVRLDARGEIKMTLSAILGVSSRPVSSTAEALYSDSKIELVLVLDNTGSMGQQNKLGTLKAAAQRFLSKMQASTAQPDAVKIGIVPFDTDVNLGALKTSSWVDAAASAFWASNPSLSGCIWDREQPHDVSDTPPTGPTTYFSADTSRSQECDLAPIMPLTQDFSALRSAVGGMVASGNTNTTIGLVWGYHLLTRSEPITNAAADSTRNVAKYIVFMTDGDNTQNRWSRGQTEIDARTRQLCANIKAARIQIFTARIIEGNSTLLRECASADDMYYDVQDVSQIDPVFTKIHTLITGMRIAR
jgi:Flp pilus assembly protein TadG